MLLPGVTCSGSCFYIEFFPIIIDAGIYLFLWVRYLLIACLTQSQTYIL